MGRGRIDRKAMTTVVSRYTSRQMPKRSISSRTETSVLYEPDAEDDTDWPVTFASALATSSLRHGCKDLLRCSTHRSRCDWLQPCTMHRHWNTGRAIKRETFTVLVPKGADDVAIGVPGVAPGTPHRGTHNFRHTEGWRCYHQLPAEFIRNAEFEHSCAGTQNVAWLAPREIRMIGGPR